MQDILKKILVVDDSRFIRAVLKDKIYKSLNTNFELFMAKSYQEALELVQNNDFHVAILDVNLPDAPNGEVIDLLIEENVPVIVLTGGMNESTKKIVLNKDIFEYVTKSSPHNFSYIMSLVKLILNNYDVYVLVVDDSITSRMMTRLNLESLHFNVLEAVNGEEALQIIETTQEHISLVLTDYEMDKMNGMELTMELRQKYTRDILAIIAVSGSENPNIASDFLRHGANDFIKKPYTNKELNARINLNLELLDLFKDVKDQANRDFLTGLHNRRFFFENAKEIFERANQKKSKLAVAMVDIDLFKRINDQYGHSSGDVAIKEIARILNKFFTKSDLIARFGGEEFCILLEYMLYGELQKKFEKIRKAFEENIITVDNQQFSYTVSIGIYYGLEDSLESMINLSDDALYEAKESGRNKVIIYRN